MRFPVDAVRVCIRWYAAYLLRYRHLEESKEKHGVSVNHLTIIRWGTRYTANQETWVFRSNVTSDSGIVTSHSI